MRTPLTAVALVLSTVTPATKIGCKVVLKPVDDERQFCGPVNAQRPAMLGSSTLARSAEISPDSAVSAVLRTCASASIAARSAVASGIGTQVTVLPLGLDDCIACPGGQPLTGCAWTACTPSKAAAPTANAHMRILISVHPLQLVDDTNIPVSGHFRLPEIVVCAPSHAR